MPRREWAALVAGTVEVGRTHRSHRLQLLAYRMLSIGLFEMSRGNVGTNIIALLDAKFDPKPPNAGAVAAGAPNPGVLKENDVVAGAPKPIPPPNPGKPVAAAEFGLTTKSVN